MKNKYNVVISGISGSLPQCNNVGVFQEKAFSDQSFISHNPKGWADREDCPAYIGEMENGHKFDSLFFGVHRKLCEVMDVNARHNLERSYEAMFDAGYHPDELRESDTAVMMACAIDETELEDLSPVGSVRTEHVMIGHSRAMQSNRVSYFFDFKGPSMELDSTWVGGISGLQIATDLISRGYVKKALVGCSNMMVCTEIAYHFGKKGLCQLNYDGKTKSFSADADGYTRAEGSVAFFLEREGDSKRSYGTIEKVICSSYMNYTGSVLDHHSFKDFIQDFYKDCDFDINDIGYVEADGCGVKAIDAIELNGLANVLCKGRKEPLLVSSCKGKVGHSGASSCFTSILNALVALKTGYIPPTIYCNEPNPQIQPLTDGSMKIVTKKTPLTGDLVAVNAIGITSSYGHVVIRRNPKRNLNLDTKYFPADNIPRLILISGREHNEMHQILNKVADGPLDDGFVAINHELFRHDFSRHLYRGFTLMTNQRTHHTEEITPYQGGMKLPVWFIYSGMGSQWPEMGKDLMKLPIAVKTLMKCHEALKPKGLDLMGIITTKDKTIFDNILNAFVGIAAIQLALTDVLEAVGIVPNGIVGHSVGELGCSYADKCLTAEQVILAAYARGKASNEAKLIKGMMAAVGVGYKQIQNKLPAGIEVACHNSSTSCTLSGPADLMEQYVSLLQSKGIFARLVNVANIAYHSKHIAPAAPKLLKYLKEIIPDPKARSNKWLSSSIPEANWETDLAKFCSAEYHTNNLLNYVLFEEVTAHIPENSITIEIAPHGLLQAILKNSIPTCTNISLTKRGVAEGVNFLFTALGKCFTAGIDLDLRSLYPKVEFPVARETNYLHTLLTWEHSENWISSAAIYEMQKHKVSLSRKELLYNIGDNDTLYFKKNYIINNASCIPFSNLMLTIMQMFSTQENSDLFTSPILFENIVLNEPIVIPQGEKIIKMEFIVFRSGRFEINESCQGNIMNGNVRSSGHLSVTAPDYDMFQTQDVVHMKQDEIYSYLADNGLTFYNNFRNILNISISERGFVAKIRCIGDIPYFIDNLLTLIVLYYIHKTGSSQYFERINNFIIDPSTLSFDNEEMDVFFDEANSTLECKGARLMYVKTKPMLYEQDSQFSLSKWMFTPYNALEMENGKDFYYAATQFISDNVVPNNDLSQKKLTLLVVNNNIQLPKELMQVLNTEDKINVSYKIVSLGELIAEAAATSEDECCLILYEGQEIPYQIQTLLMSLKTSFLLMYMKKGSHLLNSNGLTRIFEQQVGNKKIQFIKQACDDVSMENIVDVDDQDWENKVKLMDSKNGTIYFLKRYSLNSEISEFYNMMYGRELDSTKRFIFVDKLSPSLASSQEIYKKQLKRDFTVNIMKGGVWGCFANIPLPKTETKQVDDIQLINKVVCPDVNLLSIGYNVADGVSNQKSENYGLIDYCGVKGGKTVFGIATLGENESVRTDPVLYWSKPTEWTAEQAATVPLSYSMAYYTTTMVGKASKGDIVLIHGGYCPVGLATIMVAQTRQAEVYVTYFEPQQKEIIKNRFPKFDDDHMICCNGFSFTYKFLKRSQHKGANLVINYLGSEMVSSSLDCLCWGSKFVQVGKEAMEKGYSFGMGVFLGETAVLGSNAEHLFKLDKESKKEIARALDEGIRTGLVRPFDSLSDKQPNINKLPPTQANIVSHQSKAGKYEHINGIGLSKGSVVDKTRVVQLSNDRTHLIIGDVNSLWYSLLVWLVSKSAHNIVIVLDKTRIPSHIMNKYKNLVKKHPKVKTSIHPLNEFQNEQDISSLLKKIQNTLPLGTVFYINTGIEQLGDELDSSLRKYGKDSHLICMSNHWSKVSETRKRDGYKSTEMVHTKNPRNAVILNALDEILLGNDTSLHTVSVSKEIRCTDKHTVVDSTFMPIDISEVADLGYSVNDVIRLSEVKTRSPEYSISQECNPVFFLPGFKVKKLLSFARKLLTPAFMIELQEESSNTGDIAFNIMKILISDFSIHNYTIVAEGWAGGLALMLATLIESYDKCVEIILIDGAPQVFSKIAQRTSDVNLICKYLPVNKKTFEEVSNASCWTDKIDIALRGQSFSDSVTNDIIKRGLTTLRSKLSNSESFYLEHQIKGKVHLIMPQSASLYDDCRLNKFCQNPVGIHVTDAPDFDRLLENDQLLFIVSSLIVLEYREVASLQQLDCLAQIGPDLYSNIEREF